MPDASFRPFLSSCVLALVVSFPLTVVDGEAGDCGEVAVKEKSLKFKIVLSRFKLRIT